MKRYKTNRGNLNAVIRVGDNSVRIKFVAGGGGVGYFETNDLSLQKAIEKDADFGIKFFEETPICEVQPEIIVIDNINSWQEARKFLQNEPYNISAQEISSPKKIKSVAKSLGLLFKNLE